MGIQRADCIVYPAYFYLICYPILWELFHYYIILFNPRRFYMYVNGAIEFMDSCITSIELLMCVMH